MNTKWILLLTTTPFLLTGCQGALWGNMAVLGITVGVFFGTPSLGRTTEANPSTSTAGASQQGAGRS